MNLSTSQPSDICSYMYIVYKYTCGSPGGTILVFTGFIIMSLEAWRDVLQSMEPRGGGVACTAIPWLTA